MKWIKTGLTAMAVLMVSGMLMAQVPGNPGDDNTVPEAIPIDGGASLLAAAGVAYGVKKYRDYRKNSSEEEIDE